MSDESEARHLHSSKHVANGAVFDLETPLRRFVATLVDNRHEVDDVVQETMLRLLSARERMESHSLAAYAFVVARNLVNSGHRQSQTAQKHAPVLIDLRQPDLPDDAAIAREESRALAAALSALPAPQRDLFLAHEAHEQPLADVAARQGTSPGALAAQLGRTRARLRLDYLLAFRRTTLASPRCRQVLLALSAGDQRAQERLAAGRHLLTCETCAELSVPLFKRERALAGFMPWLPLPALYDRLKQSLRRPEVQAGSAVVATAGATLLAVALWGSGSNTPQPRPAASSTPSPSGPVRLLRSGTSLLSAADLSAHRGQRVRGDEARVTSVPADEGFWIEASPGVRVWVELTGAAESRQRVRAGQHVSFRGTVVKHRETYPSRVGVSSREGAKELSQQGVHIEAPKADLRVAGTHVT